MDGCLRRIAPPGRGLTRRALPAAGGASIRPGLHFRLTRRRVAADDTLSRVGVPAVAKTRAHRRLSTRARRRRCERRRPRAPSLRGATGWVQAVLASRTSRPPSLSIARTSLNVGAGGRHGPPSQAPTGSNPRHDLRLQRPGGAGENCRRAESRLTPCHAGAPVLRRPGVRSRRMPDKPAPDSRKRLSGAAVNQCVTRCAQRTAGPPTRPARAAVPCLRVSRGACRPPGPGRARCARRPLPSGRWPARNR